MKTAGRAMSPTKVLSALDRLATCAKDASGGDPARIASICVDGEFLPANSGREFDSIDPSTGHAVARLSRGDAEDVDRAVHSARSALDGPWRTATPQKRGEMLHALASALEENAETFAILETVDAGKPLSGSRGDVAGAVATLRYNAGAADKLEGTTVPLGQGFVDFTELEPIGATAHITPWNFPLGMAARSVAPALAAGCTVVLKPAEQTPLTTLALAALFAENGFPPGVVNVVTGYGEEAGAALAGHPAIDGLTFTGSVETGRSVGAAAGQALTPVVLELGGKNPMIVFEDADLDRAVGAAVEGAFDNCGQVCSSVSRLLLSEEIKDGFLERFVERACGLQTAPGMQDADIGPLVSREQYGKVFEHIDAAVSDGATLLVGGGRPAGLKEGFFVEPTVFDNVPPGSKIAREETFGPVVSAFGFAEEEHAVKAANGLPYGLAAGIFTSNIDRAMRLAKRIEAGTVWINGWFIGGVQAPTGGVKDSGFGRERGMAGIGNYVRIKNIGLQVFQPSGSGNA